jgi:phosphoribosylamine---glycine ligase
MRIFIIGSGGREHAIAWKLKQGGHAVFAAPGNPGLAQLGAINPRSDYLALARSLAADLTVVGPEAPLVAGIVDEFRAAGLAIVGPTREQARLEGSKIWAKQFMVDAGIATARAVQTHDADTALAALEEFPLPVVIKADGLAAGKGVIIAATPEQARQAVIALGPNLVIEEFLTGEEVSFIALCDGRTAIPLEATQDHKAIHDNDKGPNTGGMGAYCDGRILDRATSDHILSTVIRPVVERTGFTGFLYAGLMMTPDGPKTLEFNVRLGDPETQALMHRMRSDFAEPLAAAAGGSLDGAQIDWRPEPSVCVVLAAAGYPGKVRAGDTINGIGGCGAEVFHAGTRIGDTGLETAGGRVLGVTARGPDLRKAIDNAYHAVSRIRFEGMQFRTDIARKGLRRW